MAVAELIFDDEIAELALFPEIQSLAEMDNQPICFSFENIQFELRALRYPSHKNQYPDWFIYGLWDVSSPHKKHPVGIYNGFIDQDTAVIHVADSMLVNQEIDKPFQEFDDLLMLHDYPAMVIDPDYRRSNSSKKSDISQLFHAIALLSLRQNGVTTLDVVGDSTTAKQHGLQFNSNSGLITPAEYNSFYAKYSKVLKLNYNNGYPVTSVATDLTGTQIELIKQAFKH